MKIKRGTTTLRNSLAAMVVLLVVVGLVATPAYADSLGPFNAGSGADVGGVGTVTWSNPGNITSIGSPYATATIGSGDTTHYLQGTQYGFAIPTGSTIRGISVVINRQTSGVQAPFIRDSEIHLIKNGLVTGENKALTGTDWPTSFGGRVYGGTNDLWGTTWSVEEINASDFGVALSATNAGNSTKTATVDYMQILVYYNPGSTTIVDCGSGTSATSVGSSITCVATVTRASGSNTPSGPVFWTTNGSGSFVTSPCTLSGSGGVSTCSVNYTPSALGSGSHLITATYAGDLNFTGSNNNQMVTVSKGTPTLSVTNSPVIYNGSPRTAAVIGSVPGTVSNVLYNGSTTPPTNAGTYAVTANFTPNDTVNYESLTVAAAGDFVIVKATPTLSVTNSPVTYNSSPQAAVVTGSVPGLVSNVQYDETSTEPTDAGTYTVTANFTPNDTVNYESLTGAAAGDFMINKATPTLSVTNSPVTYNGLPQSALVAGSVPGTVSNVQYDGSAIVPTNVNTYVVTANFTPNDTVNYESLSGASAGDFVINKATPTLSVTNSPVTYNGAPQAAVVAGSVPGTVSNVQYDGSAIVPTDADTYVVTANFTPNDTVNYESLTGSAAGAFVIDKATPTLSVTNSPVTYNGTPQAAVVTGSVPGTVSNVQYDGSAIVPTDANTYLVTADFMPEDTVNYESLSGSAAGDYVIDKATPTLSVTNSPVTYNGVPQAAVVTGSVPGTVGNVKYNASSTEPTDVGTYAVTADFLPSDIVNYESLTDATAGDFVINPAGPHLTLLKAPSPATFAKMGDVINYNYELTNSGDVTLAGPFTVVDDKVTVTCPNTSSLAPTESIICNASYTITLADVLLGSVTNTAMATGSFLGDVVTSVAVEATVTSTARNIFLPIALR